MKQLDISNVKRWTMTSTVPVGSPESIGIDCPHCMEKVTLTMRNRAYDQPRGALSCSSRCPSCSETVHFWLTELISGDKQEQAQLFMRPSPDKECLSLKEFEGELPDPVTRAFESALAAYQSGNLVAATVLSRRGLEDLIKYLLPPNQRKGTMLEAIAEVAEQTDFTRPLNQLTKALSAGAKLERLCNMESEPDDASALALIEIFHSLLQYLYILPRRLDNLDSKFEPAA